MNNFRSHVPSGIREPLAGPRNVRILVEKLFNSKKEMITLSADQLYCFNNLKNYKVAFTNLNGKRTHPMNKFTVFH